MPGGGDPDNRRDFPGGFSGAARDAFTNAGRTAEERDVWNHLALLGRLRQELEPLRKGKTLDLLDEEQQLAYARYVGKNVSPVIVVFNNDTKPATIEFQVSDDQSVEKFVKDEKTGKAERANFMEIVEYRDPQDVQRLWLRNGAILTDRLGSVGGDVKIENGKVKFTMPARAAGIFTVKR
jgi:hypothetical protein